MEGCEQVITLVPVILSIDAFGCGTTVISTDDTAFEQPPVPTTV
jgi:hypothetical protein